MEIAACGDCDSGWMGMIAAAREVAQASTTVPELVGVSEAIAAVRKAAARAAASPFAVLIEGGEWRRQGARRAGRPSTEPAPRTAVL
jgi:hypothetical protein